MRYKVSGAIAIPRQAGDVPQPCRTGFGWFPKNHVSHETLLLERTVFHIRQKGVPPLLLPASVLQLPRCLVRICNLFLTNHKIANLTVSKNAIAAGKTDCKIEFASQMWATRPHLGSIFEKLLHRKTFLLPAARFLQPTCSKLFLPLLYNLRLSAQTIPVPPWNNLYKSEDFHHGNEEK